MSEEKESNRSYWYIQQYIFAGLHVLSEAETAVYSRNGRSLGREGI